MPFEGAAAGRTHVFPMRTTRCLSSVRYRGMRFRHVWALIAAIAASQASLCAAEEQIIEPEEPPVMMVDSPPEPESWRLCHPKTDPFLNNENMYLCTVARSTELIGCAQRHMKKTSSTGNDMAVRIANSGRLDTMFAETKAVLGNGNAFLDAAEKSSDDVIKVRHLMTGLGMLMAEDKGLDMQARLLRAKAHAIAATYMALATDGACAVPDVLGELKAKLPDA